MELPRDASHRPWPLPERPHALHMRWEDLLFAHWRLDPETVAARLPPGLALDTFDGSAWVGVVPFRMTGVRPRGLPPVPGHGTFPEINLRTYVRVGERPGVWFFSLDVPRRLAVWAARRFFHLPYFAADARIEPDGDGVRWTSRRRGGPPAAFEARWRPAGAPEPAAPGSLEGWLAERYCLYAADRGGRLWRGDVHHAPWPLQPAEAEIRVNAMFEQIGVDTPAAPAHVLFARAIDVVAWRVEPVEGEDR